MKALFRQLKAYFKKFPSAPQMTASSKEIGIFGEEYTTVYLEKRGFLIRERNLRLHGHELDIVAEKDGVIIFCEVKTRHFREDWIKKYGSAAQAVTKDQIKNIHIAARSYVKRCGDKYTYRFDIAEVYLAEKENVYVVERFQYMEDAFR